jgi:hypothetical protein
MIDEGDAPLVVVGECLARYDSGLYDLEYGTTRRSSTLLFTGHHELSAVLRGSYYVPWAASVLAAQSAGYTAQSRTGRWPAPGRTPQQRVGDCDAEDDDGPAAACVRDFDSKQTETPTRGSGRRAIPGSSPCVESGSCHCARAWDEGTDVCDVD